MANQVYKPRFGPGKVPDEPTVEAMKIIRGNLEDLHAAAAYFKLVVDGETALDSIDLTGYLYLPGRTGGQSGTQLDSSLPFLTLTQHASATTNAGVLFKLVGKNASSSATTSGLLLRAATSDDVTIFQLSDNGATTIAAAHTTYTSGNPILLTLQMDDATASGDVIFRIRTQSANVFTVDYYGGLVQTMSANEVGHYIRQSAGSSSDFLQCQTSALAVSMGIDSNGDLYGGHLSSSTLNLMSNDLAASSTARIQMRSTSTDIVFDVPSGSIDPLTLSLGLVSGTLSGISLAIALTSTGGNSSSWSISNASGSAATVISKTIAHATQSGDMERWLASNGSTVLSAITAAGNYQLVVGGAAGSLFTSDASGVGSWTAISALTASFADNLFSIFDNVTPTKIARFEASGLPVGTSIFNFPPLAAAGTATLVALSLAQTFTRAQTVASTADEVPLTLSSIGGQTAGLFNVYDVNANSDAGANVFQVRPYFDAATLAGTHFAGTEALNNALYVWSGAGVGAGFYTAIKASLTANRSFAFPDVNGIGLVRAGQANVQASVASIGVTSLVPASLAPEGVYIVSGFVSCVGLGPTATGSVTVTIRWSDENGSHDKILNNQSLAALSTGAVPGQSAFLTVRVAVGRITAVSLTSGGSGYAVNDLVQITTGGTGAVIQVNTLAGSAIATFTLQGMGRGYTTGTPKSSTKLTGAGTGATFNITSVSAAAAIQYFTTYTGDGVYQANLRCMAT